METMQACTGVIRRDVETGAGWPQKMVVAVTKAFREYPRFVVNRSALLVNLDELLPGATNAIPSLAERIYLRKVKGYFQPKAVDSQTGDRKW